MLCITIRGQQSIRQLLDARSGKKSRVKTIACSKALLGIKNNPPKVASWLTNFARKRGEHRVLFVFVERSSNQNYANFVLDHGKHFYSLVTL